MGLKCCCVVLRRGLRASGVRRALAAATVAAAAAWCPVVLPGQEVVIPADFVDRNHLSTRVAGIVAVIFFYKAHIRLEERLRAYVAIVRPIFKNGDGRALHKASVGIELRLPPECSGCAGGAFVGVYGVACLGYAHYLGHNVRRSPRRPSFRHVGFVVCKRVF